MLDLMESKLAFFTPKGIAIPVAVSAFPDELYQAPRSWTEKAHPKLIHYNKLDKGGHSPRGNSRSYSLRKCARDLVALLDLSSYERNDMKASCALCFVCGIAVMLGYNLLAASKPAQHVYELRMYHVNPGKMDALKARFADYTDAIFRRHNMNSIGYWQPEDPPNSQNLFVYILEHASREEAKKNWDKFHEDPAWKKVKNESEKDGPLTSQIDSYFMDPTTFSKLQ